MTRLSDTGPCASQSCPHCRGAPLTQQRQDPSTHRPFFFFLRICIAYPESEKLEPFSVPGDPFWEVLETAMGVFLKHNGPFIMITHTPTSGRSQDGSRR